VSSPPAPAQIDTRPATPGGLIALIVLAGFLYVPFVLIVYAAPDGDPAQCSGECLHGQAFVDLFGLFFGTLLWLALGGMLLLARRAMPSWAISVAFLLYCLTAVAAWGAFAAYVAADGGWSILVPALLPVLIAGYALSVRMPALAARVPADRAARIAFAALAVVIVGAVPLGFYDQTQLAAHVAADERRLDAKIAAEQAEIAKLKEQEDAKFRTLSADSPLADYVFFIRNLGDDDPRQQQALEGARHVKSRQADSAQMLDQGQIYRLVDLWRFDLQATTTLCAAYDGALRKLADDPERYDLNAGQELEYQLPNIKFFAAGGCNLAGGLGAAIARVEKIVAVNQRDQHWQELRSTLAALAALQKQQ
jgi:hypothetical protein